MTRMCLLFAVIMTAMLSGCGTTMSGRNAATAYSYDGPGGGALVSSTAHATVVTADANAFSTVSDAKTRMIGALADARQENALTATNEICTRHLEQLRHLDRYQQYRCIQTANQLYQLQVFKNLGGGAGWVGVSDAYALSGGSMTLDSLQRSGMTGMPDFDGSATRGIEQRVRRIENQQSTVFDVVLDLNAATDRATSGGK